MKQSIRGVIKIFAEHQRINQQPCDFALCENVSIQTSSVWLLFVVKIKKCRSEWWRSEAQRLKKGNKLPIAPPDCVKRAPDNKMLQNSWSSLSLLLPAVAARLSSSSLDGKTPGKDGKERDKGMKARFRVHPIIILRANCSVQVSGLLVEGLITEASPAMNTLCCHCPLWHHNRQSFLSTHGHLLFSIPLFQLNSHRMKWKNVESV